MEFLFEFVKKQRNYKSYVKFAKLTVLAEFSVTV